MPIAEAVRFLRGREPASNWKLVFSQFVLAVAIMVALGVTGVLVDYFTSFSSMIWKALVPNANNSQPVSLGVAPTLITFGVLFIFLFSIEIIGIIFVRIKSIGQRRDKQQEVRSVHSVISEKLKVSEDSGT